VTTSDSPVSYASVYIISWIR